MAAIISLGTGAAGRGNLAVPESVTEEYEAHLLNLQARSPAVQANQPTAWIEAVLAELDRRTYGRR